MKKIELKPCPFCGCNDIRVSVRRIHDGYKVTCGGCGSTGAYITIREWHDTKMIAKTQAIEAWNRRA